ncbi:MAG: cobalt-precorrin hydrolase / cobalt-factor methyltransferase / precorrin-3B [Acidimicrobiaceae bacterium]|nr:cobalt-precorrin hydrolase / cobalt-factor methyltransferase / precorrin-3B [Acidimicrobiaceae bacterium]
MRVLSVSVTEAGAAHARGLPYEHVHGSAGDTIRRRWAAGDVDAFVLFLAVGAAVRIVAPLLADKRTDPAVVCVDEAARFAIAVCGGHQGGANDLARSVAAALGAEPVITTASEVGYSLGHGLVVGVGCSTHAAAHDVQAVVDQALAGRRADAVATIDRRAEHPAVLALGLPVHAFTAEQLAAVDVPSPSDAVLDAVGTPSVAEAAALLAAGPGAALVTPKHKNATATAAVARRATKGSLALVGLGPGSSRHRTAAAAAAVRHADVVIGYGPYIDQCADLLHDGQTRIPSPIGDEVVRAKQALAEAAEGKRVALVCSGDSGVYAMASIALELASDDAAIEIDIEVVPGVTAALAAAAAVGAPLGHDHCAVSLSDLLTPWPVIERRLRAAAEGDFVVSFYNPRSQGRDWQLAQALSILAEHRPPTTPVAAVTDAGRPGQRVVLSTLAQFDPAGVGMTTCVLVGSSTTRMVNGRMVTPRGYDA